VTMLSDVTCCVTVWSCHSNPNPISKNRIKKNKSKIKWKWEKKMKNVKSTSFVLDKLISVGNSESNGGVGCNDI